MELFNMFKNELVGEQQENSAPIQGIPNQPISEVASAVGEDKGLVGKIFSMGLPLIMGQLNKNTNDPQGARSLLDALGQHENADYSSPEKIDTNDGQKILGHIFGGNEENVTNELGKQTGLDKEKVMKILTYLAPLALAYLANKKKSQNLNEQQLSDLTRDESDQLEQNAGGALEGILGGLMGGNQEEQTQESGGLLGMLGKLLGGK